jgi:RNA polymerase-binding transcription factor
MDPARAAELLTAERARVEGQLRRLDAEFQPDAPEGLSDDTDYGDQAADLTDRERDIGRIEELRQELAAVERAEKRLAEGTYGLSIVSGEPISDRRLERIPTAERTADEQRLFEQGRL